MGIAIPDRSEFEVHIGSQTRKFVFRSAAAAALEERLEMDPLSYIGQNRGQTRFIVEAIIVGLPRGKNEDIVSPGRVHKWLDDDADFDRDGFVMAVLYAIARGKPGEEGRRMAAMLDEAFAEELKERSLRPSH